MKVLFIARTYPPNVGGMQKFCQDFYNNYGKIGEIDLLANTGGNGAMPVFILQVLITLMVRGRKYDVIHFSDAVLSPLLPITKLFSKAGISFTVHGLDIVFSRFGYQYLVIPFLRNADKVFAVSQYTLDQCVQRGVPAGKLVVIPNCINFENFKPLSDRDRKDMIAKFNLNLEGRKILLTVGRLVRRKGHLWFLENVLTRLPEEYIYVMAGSGPEYNLIERRMQELGLARRTYLLGQVSDREKKCLYQMADVFVMPNIRVDGDQEGFGIVLLEAGAYNLPVVASNLEGIKDAVLDGKTGRLVPERDADSYLEAIQALTEAPLSVKDEVLANFDCNHIVKVYRSEFERMCGSNK